MSEFTCPELVASTSHSRVVPTRLESRRKSAPSVLDPSTESRNVSDTEKQATPPSDEFVVDWDGDNDPLCPRSRSLFCKWLIVCIISMGSLLV